MKLNIIYFSKDRPMQLDLALRTSHEHRENVKGDVSEYVIYKASNKDFKEAYYQVNKENRFASFIEEVTFKEDLLMCAKWSDYVMFVVDDTIFFKNYNFSKIDDILKNDPHTIGFSLRLGYNTTYCYPLNENNIMPEFNTNNGICYVNWQDIKKGDFGYPLELSSSVYRTNLIAPLLNYTEYSNPNELEWRMNQAKNFYSLSHLLYFFETSVAFSNPINKVQIVNNNRSGNNKIYSPEFLLTAYNLGFRIKDSFNNFVPNACHQEVKPMFYNKGEVI